jgi:hypothetical protein
MGARLGVALALVVSTTACSSNESGATVATGGGAGAAGADSGVPDASEAGPPATFSVPAFDQIRIASDSSKPNFQRASVDIDWGPGPFAKVTLVADLGTTCFPFDTWKNNPPPAGQNWPADCDAFDRNYEFRLDPPADAAAGPPSVELVRAITPFGGPLHTETDVTDVANGLPGKHTLLAAISTWSDGAGQVTGSDGGWFVSAHFEVVPGPAPREVLAVKSLFDGSVTNADAMSPIPFDVPAGTTSTRLEYRVTGHGGVIGAAGCGIQPADEFCLRTHALIADEELFTELKPWRDDCADLCTLEHQGPDGGGFDYCKQNPCGAIGSVKASRANWCPGSVTPPFDLEVPAFAVPGPHSFRWQISDVANGASWRVSATFFAFGS